MAGIVGEPWGIPLALWIQWICFFHFRSSKSKVATELIVFDFGMPKAGPGCASHCKEWLEKQEEYDVSGWQNRHLCKDLATR